jgi:hypothetical protein
MDQDALFNLKDANPVRVPPWQATRPAGRSDST